MLLLMKPEVRGDREDMLDAAILLEVTSKLRETINHRWSICEGVDDESFYKIAFHDYTIDMVEEFHPSEYLQGDTLDAFWDFEPVHLEEMPDNLKTTRLDYSAMVLTEEKVYWEFIPKHTYLDYQTPMLREDDFEEV